MALLSEPRFCYILLGLSAVPFDKDAVTFVIAVGQPPSRR